MIGSRLQDHFITWSQVGTIFFFFFFFFFLKPNEKINNNIFVIGLPLKHSEIKERKEMGLLFRVGLVKKKSFSFRVFFFLDLDL